MFRCQVFALFEAIGLLMLDHCITEALVRHINSSQLPADSLVWDYYTRINSCRARRSTASNQTAKRLSFTSAMWLNAIVNCRLEYAFFTVEGLFVASKEKGLYITHTIVRCVITEHSNKLYCINGVATFSVNLPNILNAEKIRIFNAVRCMGKSTLFLKKMTCSTEYYAS